MPIAAPCNTPSAASKPSNPAHQGTSCSAPPRLDSSTIRCEEENLSIVGYEGNGVRAPECIERQAAVLGCDAAGKLKQGKTDTADSRMSCAPSVFPRTMIRIVSHILRHERRLHRTPVFVYRLLRRAHNESSRAAHAMEHRPPRGET